MHNFSIVIPTLNEADNIAPLMQRISLMAETSDLNPEIIFVDDGSTDTTCEQILAYEGCLKVRLHQREGIKGLSGAVVTGGKIATCDNVVIMDSDLSHPPEIIPQLIRPLLAGKNDMVIGSRYTRGGSTPDWPLHRRLSSRLATLPAHFLTGVEDPLAGFFSIKKNLLAQLNPKDTGFKIGFELLCRYGNDIQVAEVPIQFTDRSRGKSKMHFPILVHYFLQLLNGYGIDHREVKRPFVLLLGCIAALFDIGLFSWLLRGDFDITTGHIVSFLMTMHLLFFLGTYTLTGMDRFSPQRYLLKSYGHLLLVAIPILLLRGGLLSALQNGPNEHIATLAALGFSSFTAWLLFVVTLRPRLNISRTTHSNPFFQSLILAAILYSILLRLVYLGTTELLQEEAYYWNYARHMAPGYLDHPPLVAVLIWLGTNIFGHTEAGIRLGAFLCWFITAYFSYGLTRKMFDAKTAINAVLIIAILPVFFSTGFFMTPDAPLMTCWAATLYFLYRALCREHKASWFFAGLFFGLGLASKYTIALLGPATLLFMLIDPSSRRWLRSPLPYLSVIVALIACSPVIWWNFANNWASFLFQSHQRITDVPMFTTHWLIGALLLLLTPVGLIAALYSLFPFRKRLDRDEESTPERIQTYRFCLIMTLTPLLVFLFFSLTKEVKLNWTGPLWLATVPFLAHSILVTSTEGKSSINRLFTAGWPKTIVSLIFIYGVSLHYLSIGFPGVPYPENTFLIGWDDLARQVNQKAQELEKIHGKRPIIIGMDKYRIASGITFYDNKMKSNNAETNEKFPLVTGRHLFGLNSLMFQYWHPSTLFPQQDFLVLSQSRKGIHPDLFLSDALKKGDIDELVVQKQGKKVTTFYYRLLTSRTPATSKDLVLQDNP